MSTKFKKGESGNPKGRPLKAINKIARPVKESVSEFLTEKFEELPKLWEQLKPGEQARLLVDLLPYIAPKMQAVEMSGSINFSGMSEAELDLVALKLYENEKQGK